MTRHRNRSAKYNVAYSEHEANAFAMHLLVPSQLLKQDLAALDKQDPLDDEVLQALAKKYQVPQYVMAVRIQEEAEDMLEEMA